MNAPALDDYLRLLRLYERQLVTAADARGTRLQLPFAQVIRLLTTPSPFNNTLPAPFRDVARRLAAEDKAVVAHFRYDENRQFFLGDLLDYLRLRSLTTPRGEKKGDR